VRGDRSNAESVVELRRLVRHTRVVDVSALVTWSPDHRERQRLVQRGIIGFTGNLPAQ